MGNVSVLVLIKKETLIRTGLCEVIHLHQHFCHAYMLMEIIVYKNRFLAPDISPLEHVGHLFALFIPQKT